VHLSAVTAYDPYGRPPGEENNAQAPLATDGSPSTYWETEHYRATFAQLGKPGVGLVLDATRPVVLRQLGIASQTPGFRAVVKAGDAASGPFPATVSTLQTIGSRTILSLVVPHAFRYYLIWITQLPPGQQSVRINDVTAAG
jgi:hypothetical protein